MGSVMWPITADVHVHTLIHGYSITLAQAQVPNCCPRPHPQPLSSFSLDTASSEEQVTVIFSQCCATFLNLKVGNIHPPWWVYCMNLHESWLWCQCYLCLVSMCVWGGGACVCCVCMYECVGGGMCVCMCMCICSDDLPFTWPNYYVCTNTLLPFSYVPPPLPPPPTGNASVFLLYLVRSYSAPTSVRR